MSRTPAIVPLLLISCLSASAVGCMGANPLYGGLATDSETDTLEPEPPEESTTSDTSGSSSGTTGALDPSESSDATEPGESDSSSTTWEPEDSSTTWEPEDSSTTGEPDTGSSSTGDEMMGSSTGGEDLEVVLVDLWTDHCQMEWIATEANIPKIVGCNTMNPQHGWEARRHLLPIMVEAGEMFDKPVEISPSNELDAVISGELQGVILDEPGFFVSAVGCRQEEPDCDVEWQVVVRPAGMVDPLEFATGFATGDGVIEDIEIDLTEHVGMPLDIALVVLGGEASSLDRLVLDYPRIIAD